MANVNSRRATYFDIVCQCPYKVAPAALLGPVLAVAICLSISGITATRARGGEARSVADKGIIKSPPQSTILELHSHVWKWGHFAGFRVGTIREVQARPGDDIGKQIWDVRDSTEAPFRLIEIVDEDHVKVRIPASLAIKKETSDLNSNREAVLARGQALAARTRSCDAGATYTLRFSDLNSVPSVVPDSADVIAALNARAEIVLDDRGSVQIVGPPRGLMAYERQNNEKVERWKNLDATFWNSLAALKNLRFLELCGSSATDDDLRCLDNLTRLAALDLCGTDIAGEGLRHAAGLKRLESLSIGGTRVGDDSIGFLMHLPRLRDIRWGGSEITSVGLWRLANAIPHLQISDDTRGWGRLSRANRILGPFELRKEAEAEKSQLLQLLVLGCSVTERDDKGNCSATVPVPRNRMSIDTSCTNAQIQEALRLLPSYGNVVSLRFLNEYYQANAPWLEGQTMAVLSQLRCLKELDLQRCGLTESAWLEVGRLKQLHEIKIDRATISHDMERHLRMALPDCRIVGLADHEARPPARSLSPKALERQLRLRFPGKTDYEIVRQLRDCVTVDDGKAHENADWLATRVRAGHKQWEAVQWVEAHEGFVRYDYQLTAGFDFLPESRFPIATPLRELLGDDFFRAVVALKAGLPPAGTVARDLNDETWLPCLCNLPHLRYLHIINLRNERNLSFLLNLQKLEVLRLDESELTREGLEKLKDLPNLRSLRISAAKSPDLTALGIESLKDWPKLKHLTIDGTQANACGIERLSAMRQLGRLDIVGDADTKLLELKKTLPNCKVNTRGLTVDRLRPNR